MNPIHPPDSDAYGIFAAAILNEVTQVLIGKGVISKEGMLDICAATQKALSEKGIRNDNAAETDAALLATSLSIEIERRF